MNNKPSFEEILAANPSIADEIDKLSKQIAYQHERMMIFGGLIDTKRKVKKTKLGKILYK